MATINNDDVDDNDNDFAYQLEQEEFERQQKRQQQSCGENSNIYRDPTDGTEYEWDPMKKAWFPKINDDFIAKYQASYGQFDNDESDANITESKSVNEEKKSTSIINTPTKPESIDSEQTTSSSSSSSSSKKRQRDEQQQQQTPQWFEVDDQHNTNVYVSNLPLDITLDEFITLMKKCGLIMKDDRFVVQIFFFIFQNQFFLFSLSKTEVN